MYIQIKGERIVGCSEQKAAPDYFEVVQPDDFIPDEMHLWSYVDGEFIKHEESEEKQPTYEQRIAALEAALTAIEEGIASV